MKRLTIPTFLPNKGIALDKPDEFLLQSLSPYSRNMEFYNEFLQGRLGLTKFDTAQLNGAIKRTHELQKFNGTYFLMFFTNEDIYSYDFSNSRFDILTPTYTTGTITIHAGDPTVVHGAGGMLWSTNLKTGDFIKIGAGSIHTGSTWYEILTVDSDTQLTLTAAAATCSGSAYVARKIYNGTASTMWSTVSYVDDTLGEMVIATNGVDTPCRWTGTGQMAVLTGLATGFTTAKYVDVFGQRVVFLWTVEGGQNQPQRERWSAVANCNSYTDTDFADFMDEDTWITGSANLAGYHVVFKEEEAYVGRFVGGEEVFEYDRSTSCVGTNAPFSIVRTKDTLYYYGFDNKFHKWNLLRDDVISEGIYPDTQNFDPNMEQYLYGAEIKSRNQIRWHCPYSSTSYNNYTVTYDYKFDIVQIWTYEQAQACCCIGEYILQSDLYVDDVVWGEYYIDEQDGYWDDRSFLANAPIPIYGGYDGYVRKCDASYTDDGTTYTRTFISSRQNYGAPEHHKRLNKQQIWLDADLFGSVTVSLRKGDSATYEAATNAVSLVSAASKETVKENIYWDKEDINFQTKIEATNHFALLGYLNTVFAKRLNT